MHKGSQRSLKTLLVNLHATPSPVTYKGHYFGKNCALEHEQGRSESSLSKPLIMSSFQSICTHGHAHGHLGSLYPTLAVRGLAGAFGSPLKPPPWFEGCLLSLGHLTGHQT